LIQPRVEVVSKSSPVTLSHEIAPLVSRPVFRGINCLDPKECCRVHTDDPATVTKALYVFAIHHMGFTPDTVKASRRG